MCAAGLTCLYGALPVAATLVSSEDWNQPAARQASSTGTGLIRQLPQHAGAGSKTECCTKQRPADACLHKHNILNAA
jgi:hypothetical protein